MMEQVSGDLITLFVFLFLFQFVAYRQDPIGSVVTLWLVYLFFMIVGLAEYG